MGTDTGATRVRAVIVDDSDDVRYLIATVMEFDGRFEIVGEAHDAGDAVSMVADTAPDLVLVDLQLGADDGAGLIRELRRLGHTSVLAVVTASAVQSDHAAALEAGADSVHNKMSMTSTMVDDLAALVAARSVAA